MQMEMVVIDVGISFVLFHVIFSRMILGTKQKLFSTYKAIHLCRSFALNDPTEGMIYNLEIS